MSELDDMRKERDHWKANHDNMVVKNAILSQRPDLPLERIQACAELDELRVLVDKLIFAYQQEYLTLSRTEVKLIFSDVLIRREQWNQ